LIDRVFWALSVFRSCEGGLDLRFGMGRYVSNPTEDQDNEDFLLSFIVNERVYIGCVPNLHTPNVGVREGGH
jgi:hypothetical protein